MEEGNKLKVRIIYYLGLFLEQFDELGIWKFVFLFGFISYCFGSLCIRFPFLFLVGESATGFPFYHWQFLSLCTPTSTYIGPLCLDSV